MTIAFQTAEIAAEIGWLMGKSGVSFTNSEAALIKITHYAEQFQVSDDGDRVEEMQAYVDRLYNQLVEDGLIGEP